MKLGYLVSQYPAVNHTFVLREIGELRRSGFDVFTVSVRRPDRPLHEMTSVEADEARRSAAILDLPAMRIVRIHLATLFHRPRGYLRGITSAFGTRGTSLSSVLLSLAYFAEAVVAGNLFVNAGVKHFHVHFSSTVGWLVTRMFPLGMSITFHGMEFFEPLAFRLREKIEESVFVRGISSFGVSQMMMAAGFSNWSGIEKVPLGVDGSTFHPPSRERAANSVVELLSVARLSGEKGQHILLDAMAELIAKNCPVRLRLVGDGPDRSALLEHAEKLGITGRVLFEGWVNQDRILDYYSRADIFVLASFAEGIPVVLMEAMAMELAVAATWISGVPELVENEKNGLLCPPADPSALADCIARLVCDAPLRARLGAAGRRTVLEKFDLIKNGRAWAQLLRRRLSDAAPEDQA